MKRNGLDDVLVLAGGIIPDDDVPRLKEVGIAEVFGPGTMTEEVIEFIKRNLKRSL